MGESKKRPVNRTEWDPAAYERFADERTRPARQLLARDPWGDARLVVDLGCGSGSSTELLLRRWPAARIEGVDTSPAMLAAERKRLLALAFQRADASRFTPAEAPDVIFANALLQWIPDHPGVLARLMGHLRAGGVLALSDPRQPR